MLYSQRSLRKDACCARVRKRRATGYPSFSMRPRRAIHDHHPARPAGCSVGAGRGLGCRDRAAAVDALARVGPWPMGKGQCAHRPPAARRMGPIDLRLCLLRTGTAPYRDSAVMWRAMSAKINRALKTYRTLCAAVCRSETRRLVGCELYRTRPGAEVTGRIRCGQGPDDARAKVNMTHGNQMNSRRSGRRVRLEIPA